MHPVESQFFVFALNPIHPFVLLVLKVSPTYQQVLLIEKEFPGGAAVLGQQPGVVIGTDKAVVI